MSQGNEPDPIPLNRRSYDEIAARFAARTAQMDERLAEIASRFLARVPPGGRVLDLGCGAGRDLAWFDAQRLPAVGADLSAGMLAEARKVTKSAVCQMEMRQLGFPSNTFAGIWCNAAMLHLWKQDVPAALAEVARVLSHGGCFFLIVQEGAGEGVETNQAENVTRFFARYESQEMAGLLERAGFQVLHQGEYTYGRQWLWFETVR